MDLYGRNSGWNVLKPDRPAKWVSTGLEESIWRLGLSGRALYPERPGVSDCLYFMQNGLCGFGSRCRYNHPRDRTAAIAVDRLVGGEHPERPGEPVCQYYLKTGTCKFGVTCKFNHPQNAGGTLANAPLNCHGYPLRLGEKECSYYVKTKQCKFGITCKFHHPQPASMVMPASAPPLYPTMQLPPVPMPQQAAESSPGCRIARPPLLPCSYVPGTYGPLLLSPGLVPMPGWMSYSGLVSPGNQRPVGAGSMSGVSQLSPGSYPSLPSNVGFSSSSAKDHKFPERPGEPECQYYMKTGNCKFGVSCKYHHPLDRVTSTAACFLGPLGLPLRLGAQPCTFYLQNGYCKFGPTCKFDHPMSTMKYNLSDSSLTEIPVAAAPYLVGSSLPTFPALSLSALRPQYPLKSHWAAESNKMPSGNSSVGLTFTQSAAINVEWSGYNSGHSRGGNQVHHSN